MARSTCSGLAKRLKARILQASTSEVYGDPTVHPQAESYWGNVNPIGPRACYDEGKRCAETLFFDYHRQHGVPIKVARIFNTYGPRMQPHDGRVVSNFIVQALRGEPITLYGDGSQTRSFCYRRRSGRRSDAADGSTRRASPDRSTSAIPASSPCSSWRRRSSPMTGSRSRIEFRPLPADDPRQRQPDISAGQAVARLAARRCRWRRASSARSPTSRGAWTAMAEAGGGPTRSAGLAFAGARWYRSAWERMPMVTIGPETCRLDY